MDAAEQGRPDGIPALPTDALIWWTSGRDCDRIGRMALLVLPDYLMDQLSSREGRSGRGRLWVDDDLWPDLEEIPWPNPETARAKALADQYAGIVIRMEDAQRVIDLPGIITDLRLEPYGQTGVRRV
jgi:hypothetical protein